ncbi:Heavy-metal-associated domain [Musa troglodytarum]|uniref:Heavy-metal-associated domain n=1 Tax=Musa troglodytarum TaxID=320322 RepID=A0A9E7L756_9LILI|nr:Heavy-metal-associated domain [Musa troglodytarum]
MKKIVLKVCIMCCKCKSCIMTTISKFYGVVSITMDAEKSTVTVVGNVDAVLIVNALRKKKRPAEVVSVGEPDKEKKEEKKPEPSKPLPSCCTACKAVVKIVLKVSIMCGKCKSCIMTTISKFHGVVSITMDAEKSTATVVGDVDAVLIVKALRKKKRPAEVVSVGEPDKEKKEEKKPEPSKPLPSCCTACKAVVVWYDEPNPCSIL